MRGLINAARELLVEKLRMLAINDVPLSFIFCLLRNAPKCVKMYIDIEQNNRIVYTTNAHEFFNNPIIICFK